MAAIDYVMAHEPGSLPTSKRML